MENVNLLTYSTGLCRVISRGIAFENNTPPVLSFSFDSLYYEPILNHSVKIVDLITYQLTEEEKQECESFAYNFIDTADYSVYAYDSDFLYVGIMLKSEAISKNYNYRIVETPNSLASKWNTFKEQWEKIVAVVLDDGTLHLNPEVICEKCMLFFTEEEWMNDKNRPQVIYPDDVWKYNFSTETWYNDKDYVVYAYDDVFCFVGEMMKSTAIREGYNYTTIEPKNPVSKWTGSTWEIIVASIKSDGILILNPAGICGECVEFLTQSEWDIYNKPSFDDIKRDVWKYDFVNSTWTDISEYLVYTYEKESKLFIDTMPKRIALQKDYGWTLVEVPVFGKSYKWIDNQWEPIVAIIRSDGSLTFKTEYVCEQCVLFFTQKEWDAFIKPPVHPSTSLHGYENTIYSWDFATETWVDKRVFSELFKLLETTLRNYFEDKRVETWGANIKSYEKETWQNQVYEARNYINDNMFETPAIDTYLQYIENKIDKLELCKRIITNNLEFNKMTMRINAIQKNWLNKLNLVTTNLEADALFEEFHTAIVNDTLL